MTDQTSAHDPLAYLPIGVSFEDWVFERERDPEGFTRARPSFDGCSRRGDGRASWTPERKSSTTGTRFARGQARRLRACVRHLPGFVPAYIRPFFCEGKGPFRWAALSGEPR